MNKYLQFTPPVFMTDKIVSSGSTQYEQLSDADLNAGLSPFYVCPECNSPVRRVRRRLIDRIVSLITPVRRYRCCAYGWGCNWRGNLRVRINKKPATIRNLTHK